MGKGLFFTFEGIEGSGKSTLIQYLQSELESKGHTVVSTREPGSTTLGKKIRSLLLDSKEDTQITSMAELLLFFADRAQHIAEVIKPALHNGSIILCDRYIHSTIAYQAYGRGLDRAQIDQLCDLVVHNTLPNACFLLDIDYETSVKRISGREGTDRIEKEDRSFHENVRQGFLELAKEDPDLFITLDGTTNIDSIRSQAMNYISKKLKAL